MHASSPPIDYQYPVSVVRLTRNGLPSRRKSDCIWCRNEEQADRIIAAYPGRDFVIIYHETPDTPD